MYAHTNLYLLPPYDVLVTMINVTTKCLLQEHLCYKPLKCGPETTPPSLYALVCEWIYGIFAILVGHPFQIYTGA